MKLHYLLLFLGLCYSSSLEAQKLAENILLEQKSILNDQHEGEFGDIRNLISGREHQAVYHFTLGHPFWVKKSWFLGDLQTDLHFYPDLTLRYDIYRDRLLYLPDSLSLNYLAVGQEQVVYFMIGDTYFYHLGLGEEKAALLENNMKSGYYELIYSGKVLLYAKNKKELKGKTGDSKVHSEFFERRYRYLYVNNAFFLIKKRKDLLRALPKFQVEMKNYLRQNRINLKRIGDPQFVQILSYYDSL
ncbi:MAG: hypothetical protein AAF696_06060 [Bacteroidota bacterium]